MTLTQLNAFVLVARLGSVTAAANALGVSEPAVSQALAALRAHLGDQLVSRGPSGMTLTAGGSRLLATASAAEFVASPLVEAFSKRFAAGVDVTSGVAVSKEVPVLVANRLADV